MIDAATANSAVRNLHQYDFDGRSLRVNLAQYDSSRDSKPNNQQSQDSHSQSAGSHQHSAGGRSGGPSAPSGVGANAAPQAPLLPGSQSYSAKAISSLLSSLTKAQLLDVLNESQKFIRCNPEGSRQLLIDNPQLTYSLLHIQIMFGLIKPDDVAQVLQQQGQKMQFAPQSMQPQATMMPMQAPMMQHPHMGQQQQQSVAPPPHFMPPPMSFQAASLPAPPLAQLPLPPFNASQQPMQAPPMPQSAPINSAPVPAPVAPVPLNAFGVTHAMMSHLSAAEQSALREIVLLAPADIAKLPQTEQQTVIQLLQKLRR